MLQTSSSYLCDGYGLLFHSFVDSYSVVFSHFVELVDADDASISQHHGASFHHKVALQFKPLSSKSVVELSQLKQN